GLPGRKPRGWKRRAISPKELERVKKYRSHSVKRTERAVFLVFCFVSAQLQGFANLLLRRSLAKNQKSSLRIGYRIFLTALEVGETAGWQPTLGIRRRVSAYLFCGAERTPSIQGDIPMCPETPLPTLLLVWRGEGDGKLLGFSNASQNLNGFHRAHPTLNAERR